MGRFASTILVGLLALVITACASTSTKDIQVKAQTASNVNINAYKTYAWLAAAKIVNDPAGQWEPPNFDADAEIKWLIDRELRKRGIAEVTVKPDMFVAFVAGVDMLALELKQDPKQKIDMLESAPKGALAVLFIDGVTGEAIWAGSAVADVARERPGEEVKKRLDYAVSEMFRKLPGRSSGY